VLDLRAAPGVRVTVFDSRKGFHRIDLRLCPVPFRHLVSEWIESLYGTPEKPVPSTVIKGASTWLFILLRFYADQYPSDDDLGHLSTDVIRKWVRAALPQWQPTRDARLDYVGRRLKALVQFCDWAQLNEPGFLPSALMPATHRSAGVAEVAAACEAPLKALLQRACELGVLVGGAERTTHLFGRRINRHHRGKLQTVLDQRDAGHPVLRWYYQTSFAKQYVRGDQHSDRILRTETCSNDTRHFGIGRRLDKLSLLGERLATTNERCLALQAELLASTVDTGHLAALAEPTVVGQRRIPSLKLHDDRVIRVLEALLHPGAFAADWTSRELHARIMARHHLADSEYRLSQLRYDLSKLRAKGLIERLGTSRRYRLTAVGLKLGVLLVKLRTRLLGPLVTTSAPSRPRPRHSNSVEAAFREIDAALDHLSAALGLQHAA